MKPKKWNMRRYAMLGAIAVAVYMLWTGWPGASAPELAWWAYGGYIFAGAVAGALVGAGVFIAKTLIER